MGQKRKTEVKAPPTNGVATRTITVPMVEVPLPIGNFGESSYITRHVESQLDLREAIALKHLVAGVHDGKMSSSKAIKFILDRLADELGLPEESLNLSDYSGKIQDIP